MCAPLGGNATGASVSPLARAIRQRWDTSVGFRFATSFGGGILGEGGDVIIVDDLHKPDEVLSKAVRDKDIRWFDEVVPTRLNDKLRSVIFVVMQRLHEMVEGSPSNCRPP